MTRLKEVSVILSTELKQETGRDDKVVGATMRRKTNDQN